MTNAWPSYYLINKSADTNTIFKYLDANLLVKRVLPKTVIQEAQEKALEREALARPNLERVNLKSFTFSAGSKSQSIDNTVLRHLPKSLLFTMFKNTDFNGSVDTTTNTTNLDIMISVNIQFMLTGDACQAKVYL